MKRKLAFVFIAVFTVLMTLPSALATAGGSVHGRHFTLIERGTDPPIVDLPPSGDSPGDRVVFTNPLFDETNVDQLGADFGECTFITLQDSKEGGNLQCLVTVKLPGGTLTVHGLLNFANESSTFAITGGTGDYRKARGEVTLTDTGDDDRLEFNLAG